MSAAVGSGSRSIRLPVGAFGRRPVIAGATAVVAWSCMALVARSPAATYLSHDVLGRAGVPVPAAVAGYSAGWLLMVSAMMLPVALLVDRPVRCRPSWLIGYLGAWLTAGSVFAGLDLLLHAVVGPATSGPLHFARTGVMAGGASLTLVMAWRKAGRHVNALDHAEPVPSSGHGWLHGVRCVGTCGPMMLALQAGAPGDMFAMALVAGGLAVVRLGPRIWQFGPVRAVQTGSHPNSFSPSQVLTSGREGEPDDEPRGDVPVGPPGPVRGGGREGRCALASRAAVVVRGRGSGRV